jgi:hypothetical protein
MQIICIFFVPAHSGTVCIAAISSEGSRPSRNPDGLLLPTDQHTNLDDQGQGDYLGQQEQAMVPHGPLLLAAS